MTTKAMFFRIACKSLPSEALYTLLGIVCRRKIAIFIRDVAVHVVDTHTSVFNLNQSQSAVARG